MRFLAAGMLLLLPLSTSAASAQVRGQTLGADAEQIVWAAVEAFALRPELRDYLGAAGTLVVPRHTTEVESTTARRGASWAKSVRRDFSYHSMAINNLATRSGLSIVACDTMTADYSLCGVPQPWVWLAVSNPTVEGDRAIIIIEERQLETAPGVMPDRQATYYDVTLLRERGIWRVIDIVPDGSP